MDWRDYKKRGRELFRMAKTKTEFDLLVQRTNREINLRAQIRDTIRLFERTSPVVEKVSAWRDFARNAYDTGKSLFFRKKL